MHVVEPGILGSKVVYRCDRCRTYLVMPLRMAGQRRRCTKCNHHHVVPGEADKKADGWGRWLHGMRSSANETTEISVGDTGDESVEEPVEDKENISQQDRQRHRIP